MTDDIELGDERYFHSTGEKYKNPYPTCSDEFNRFERGWTQALKKSRIDHISRAPGDAEYPLLSPSELAPPRNPVQQQADEYKSRKG